MEFSSKVVSVRSSYIAMRTIKKITIIAQMIAPIEIPMMFNRLAFFDASSASANLLVAFASLTYKHAWLITVKEHLYTLRLVHTQWWQ